MKNKNDKVMSMRISEKTLEKMQEIAQKQGRTTSNLIRYILENYIQLHS